MKIKIKIDIDKLKNDVISQLGESLLKRATVLKDQNLATNLRIWIQAKMNKLHSTTIAEQSMIEGFDQYAKEEEFYDFKKGLYQFIQDDRYDSALRRVCAVTGFAELTRTMLILINGFSNEWYVLRQQSSQGLPKETISNHSTENWTTWLKDNGLYIDIHIKSSSVQCAVPM